MINIIYLFININGIRIAMSYLYFPILLIFTYFKKKVIGIGNLDFLIRVSVIHICEMIYM